MGETVQPSNASPAQPKERVRDSLRLLLGAIARTTDARSPLCLNAHPALWPNLAG